ncbi:MAG: histidine--tRNA ligase [candidate division Zixibacteria bacterium]|nr:histidine--tRNA ligase [candidate division Zixibacteria bacterium]
MKALQRIKGTDDILPPESRLWRYLYDVVHQTMSQYGYNEIIVPMFEYTELFARGIGEATDIVSKEMYTFKDMGGRSITLRPEGTASVVRAFTENSLGSKSPLSKLYYIGPMFRQEKPQKGRKRQFYQFGLEVLGTDSPFADVEGIVLNVRILQKLGINDTQLMINSIGDPESRSVYKESLKEYIKSRLDNICDDCRKRYENNPLRVLDCKRQECRKEMQNAPSILEHLNKDSKKHFESVKAGLDAIGIEYKINERLVRGLDYYTRTVYEIVSSSLGAQDSISGGGRYDLLVEELGGKPTPAFGFAAGIERIILAMDGNKRDEIMDSGIDCFIAVLDTKILTKAFELAENFRKAGLSVEIELLGRSLKAQMREANRSGAKTVVMLGEDEINRNVYGLKNMATGDQKEYPLESIPDIP